MVDPKRIFVSITNRDVMVEFVSESVAEILALVGSAIGSAVFTVGGVLIEHSSIQSVVAGQSTVGLWEMYMGVIALTVGLYLLGYRECWPRLMEYRRGSKPVAAEPNE